MHLRFKDSAWRFFLNMTLFSTIANGTTLEYCPKGWHYYHQRERCFLLEYKPMTWDQARVMCKGYGGDLTTIPDNQTNEFVKGLIEYPSCAEYWIGLQDRSSEGVFHWLDQDDATNFTYWAHKEPNNVGDEDCVFISAEKDSHWNDAACGAHVGFSCERTAKNSTVLEPARHTSTTPKPEHCPEGWHYYDPRQRCFLFDQEEMTWDQARVKCKGYGGDLTTIPDSQTNEFVRGLIPYSSSYKLYWIGLHDRISEGVFHWLDQDGAINFTGWAKNQPDDFEDNGEDCVHLSGILDYFWNDYSCRGLSAISCERAAN